MTMLDAIAEAKRQYMWSVTSHEPTSVAVVFYRYDQTSDETELDLYSDDPETELIELWESLAAEMESAIDQVISVDVYGWIAN